MIIMRNNWENIWEVWEGMLGKFLSIISLRLFVRYVRTVSSYVLFLCTKKRYVCTVSSYKSTSLCMKKWYIHMYILFVPFLCTKKQYVRTTSLYKETVHSYILFHCTKKQYILHLSNL